MKLFEGATSASASKPWFVSIAREARRAWSDFRNPTQQVEVTAAPVEVREIWSKRRMIGPRTASALLHAALAAAALTPWAATRSKIPPEGLVNVALYAPKPLTLPASERPGGGGGGRRAPQAPSLGKLPKAADRQITPPDPTPVKNLDPVLIAEPTIVAAQLPALPQLDLLTIGDPNGLPGPASGGPGGGSGIGDGDGTGVGNRKGPGAGPADGVGNGRPVVAVGGGVSSPVLISQVLPEYSEAARKARFEGTVVLDTIVLEDGSVQVVNIARSCGYGLDEKAIEAVRKWRFRPARMDGKAVAVALNIQVTFAIR